MKPKALQSIAALEEQWNALGSETASGAGLTPIRSAGLEGNEWLLTLPIPRRGRALVISGGQSLSALLASVWFDEVQAWDTDSDRVDALRDVSMRLGLPVTAHHVTSQALPATLEAEPGRFDVVVFVHAFEPTARDDGASTRLAAAVATHLDPTGTCVILANNAWSIDRFRALPRFWHWGGNGGETGPAISVRRAKSFVRATGASESRLRYFDPDAGQPKEIFDTALPSRVSSPLSKLVAAIGLERYLNRAFLLSGPCGHHESLLERLARCDVPDRDAAGVVIAGRIEVRDTSTLMMRCGTRERPEILRVPLTLAAWERQQRALDVTAQLRREFPVLSRVVPESTGALELEGVWGYRERVVAGSTAHDRLMRGGSDQKVMDNVLQWLAEFHLATSNGETSSSGFRSQFDARVVRGVVSALPDEAAGLRGVWAAAERSAGAGSIPLVWMHGDFNGGNVLCDDQAVVAVLDWDQCEPNSAPMLDCVHFIVSFRRRCAAIGQGEAVVRALDGTLFEPGDTDLFRQYGAAIGLEVTDLAFWLRAYWFNLLAQHVRAGHGQLGAGARKNVLEPALDRLRGD